MAMQLEKRVDADAVTFFLKGRMDAHSSTVIESELEEALEAGFHRIVFDMSQVSFMSSAGARMLLKFYRHLSSSHVEFSVDNPSLLVARMLELSGLALLLAENRRQESQQNPLPVEFDPNQSSSPP